MADVEKRVENLETKFVTLEQQVNNVLTKLDMFIAESREARQRQDADMREMRKKHDDDIREIRQDMKAMQSNLDLKIDGMVKHVRNMSIVTIIGVATIVVAILLK